MRIREALTRSRAATSPDAPDPRLRGRTYAFPFDRVWRAVLSVAGSRPQWTVVSVDPRAGLVHAEARTTLWKFVDDVEVRVSLDHAGLTRVDVTSASRVGRADLGANARRIARFLQRLDEALAQR